jgi:hypothetical protein
LIYFNIIIFCQWKNIAHLIIYKSSEVLKINSF